MVTVVLLWSRLGVCYMLQSVVAETALIALTSRLLFLFKTSPLLDANILADLTGIDNRFPLGKLNRSEKVAAENMDGGDAEDTESEDDEDDDDDDDDDGEDGSEDDDDDNDSDAETSGDGGSDEDDDNDSDEDDEDDSDDESDEDDEESDEEDDKKMQAQPPSEKKK
ncbi:hypothetical protein OIU85_026849 [Salix viminalis]|uniref:Uncharacterized protein n=1 Tax=Salix viminalis TaxID=40686 RepID=A0A9Q0YZ21_SALVM|nr:hypothetical protein OIU85_026849 [Salix viminalis]